jgi:hypothetical protein
VRIEGSINIDMKAVKARKDSVVAMLTHMEMKMKATWQPHEEHGELTKRSDLPHSVFAFPKQRKEPLTDANHVRDAIARFDQTIGVSDADRELAFANIKKAANYYGIAMTETDLGPARQESPHRSGGGGP